VLTLQKSSDVSTAQSCRPTTDRGSCVGWIDCGPCALGSRVLVGPDGRL